jgi:hypothetical protein
MDDPRIGIMAGAWIVGELTFPRKGLLAEPALNGLVLTLPMRIVLRTMEVRGKPIRLPSVSLSDIGGSLRQGTREIATTRDERYYATPTDAAGTLRARLSSDAIWEIEKQRDGGPLRFSIELHAISRRIFNRPHTPEEAETNGGGAQFVGKPTQVNEVIALEYAALEWANVLNGSGFGEHVTVQVDLPNAPPPPWAEVWKAVREARESLSQGGESGWKGCINACRLALERWQQIEPEDHGPGWTAPSPQDRKIRTTRQRGENLRWDLLQCAHEGPHSDKDRWTRDDAILLLSTLTALLAKRKP